MSTFDAWLDRLADHVRNKEARVKYKSIVHDCADHRGADFCTACKEEVDEDGNTESRFEYCSRHCGCMPTGGCPMGGKRVD